MPWSYCEGCRMKRCHYCSEQGTFIIKVILVGDSGVGKTELLRRFRYDVFDPHLSARVARDPVSVRTIETDGKTVKFFIFELEGWYRRYRLPINQFFKEVAGVLLVYDVTNRSTFERIDYWREEIRKNATYHSNVPILLIGSKSDLQNERQVPREEARVYAGKNGMSFIETSAARSTNVVTAFENIFKEIHGSKDIDDRSLFVTSTEIVNVKKEDTSNTSCWWKCLKEIFNCCLNNK